MRTVDQYRGLQIYVLEPGEEVPSWARSDVQQGRAVMATGDFKSPAALAHILDRYIDEMLRGEGGPSATVAPPAPSGGFNRPRGGPR